ncbi:MAG: glycoside hydrolase family 3 C-terminal domain-containing protein [Kiritimatiellae bacterium]|nr:glycoside hydrolase family 3 C-terminal domain-containing protein [Kiritimatiellia bacterium]
MKKFAVLGYGVVYAFAAFALMDDAEAFARARERLGKMTLDEKVLLAGGSGTMTLGAIERVGIMGEWTFSDNSSAVRRSLDRWTWDNAGDAAEQISTSLPTMSALAATWNRDLARLHGETLGSEARARGVDQILGPGVNIMRTPLCGRNWEYLGEDPALASAMARGIVEGVQSRDVAATVKHFCLNSQEWNRNNVDTVCDERTLNEIYLPAFRAALLEGGSLGVMSAYNKVNGAWASENAYLQRGILRDRWHFPGMIVTDWGGQHSTVDCALNGGGVEMNRGDDLRYFVRPVEGKYPLADAVRRGDVPEAALDEIALHTLYVMEKVHFFAPEKRAPGERDTAAHRAAALEIAQEAAVLLKNDGGVLPLDKSRTRKLLVIGRLATSEACRKGWSMEGNPPYEITLLDGLKEYLGEEAVALAPLVAGDEAAAAVHPVEADMATFDTSARDMGMSVKAWKATYWKGRDQAGSPAAEGFTRKVDTDWKGEDPVPGVKAWDFSARFETRLVAPEEGEFIFSVKCSEGSGARLFVDGAIAGDEWDGGAGKGIAAKISLRKGEEKRVRIDYRSGGAESVCRFGWILPSERTMSVQEVKEAALAADAVVIATGTEIGHGRGMECEGGDRPDMKLPIGHDAAIEEILSWGIENTIVVNRSGAPVEMPWARKATTILHTPYLGQEAGRAVARILFGEGNPSGRLAFSWPVRYEDTAVARKGSYNEAKSVFNERFYTGYRWHDKEGIAPLFPFGHGLSYTAFEWGELRTDGTKISIPVTNTGSRPGKEVVEIYVAPVEPAIERPVKELKGFAKILVAPGETRIAEAELGLRDFAYYDDFLHCFRTDAGRYRILAAASAGDVRAEAVVEIPETVLFAN